MSRAILTIDDISSANTSEMVNYLYDRQISAIMFAVGKNVEKYYEEAVHAVKKGMIVGNHSYSHPSFSTISFAECVEEIEKTEAILDKLYEDAGIKRLYKPFRFPYGDKGKGEGGSREHYEKLQKYLQNNGFTKVVDTQITFQWYEENHLHQDIDTFWTFDFGEWQIRQGSGFSVESVYQRIHEKKPASGGALLEEGSHHIVLLHAHDETEAIVPRYYEQFIEYCMNQGVEFVEPKFYGRL